MPIHRSTTGNEKKKTSGMQFQTGQVVYTILWNDDLNLSNCCYFQTRCPFACFASYSSRPTLLVMQPPPPRPTHSAPLSVSRLPKRQPDHIRLGRHLTRCKNSSLPSSPFSFFFRSASRLFLSFPSVCTSVALHLGQSVLPLSRLLDLSAKASPLPLLMAESAESYPCVPDISIGSSSSRMSGLLMPPHSLLQGINVTAKVTHLDSPKWPMSWGSGWNRGWTSAKKLAGSESRA